MKYLKLYESYHKRSLLDFINDHPNSIDFDVKCGKFNCYHEHLTSLKGIEKLNPNTESFDCNNNQLKTLHGIERFTKLEFLCCNDNQLENLHGIENLTAIESLYCYGNQLKNLKELKNLINLKILYFYDNKISDLKDIYHLKNLTHLEFSDNKIEKLDMEDIKHFPKLTHLHFTDYPVSEEVRRKFQIAYYQHQFERFQSYEFQKDFLTKYPERVEELKLFGIHEKIREEFPDLVEGSEFGFFNLR